MLVIRLQRRGKKNQPFFWLVVAQKTAPVKGKFIEKLGFWNPIKKMKGIKGERVKYWLSKGAKVSDSVYNLLIEEKIIEGEKRKIKIKSKKKEEKPQEKLATEEGEKSVNPEEKRTENSSAQPSKNEDIQSPKEAEPKEDKKSEEKNRKNLMF